MPYLIRNRRPLYAVILVVITTVVYGIFFRPYRYKNIVYLFDEYINPNISTVQNSNDVHSIRTFLHMAEKIKSTGKPVLITVINDAYVPFAQSWLCNTVYMGIHPQVIIIATDVKSRETLSRQWPSVNVVSLPGGEEFNGNQEYTQAGIVRIMIWRTRVLMELVRYDVEFMLFEVDCLWLGNPLPETQRQGVGSDIIGIKIAEQPGFVGGGYLYVKANPRAKKLWRRLTEMLLYLGDVIRSFGDHDVIPEWDNDQVYLTNLVYYRYADIRVKLLDLDLFPDGKWYTWSETHRNKVRPLLINNNWVVGIQAKIERAKNWNHWFWDPEHASCDFALVNRTTRPRQVESI